MDRGLRSAVRLALSVVVVSASHAPLAHAQAPAGFDTLSARAVAESLKVLDQLGKTVRENPKDAASWYHRGMIAFALSERARDTVHVIPGLKNGALRITASDALRAARDLEPNNKRFARSVDEFDLTDRTPSGRMSARPILADADLEHYATEPDSAERLRRMLGMGWVAWNDYDGYANRALSSFADPANTIPDLTRPTVKDAPTNSAPWSVFQAANGPPTTGDENVGPTTLPIGAIMKYAIDSVLATLSNMPFEVAGEIDYLKAKTLFEASYALAPTDDRAFWPMAMLLTARDNWGELRQLGLSQTRSTPQNAWGWIAFALGSYRLRADGAAQLFDSAFARLNPRDRARLDRIERVLRPTDSTRFRRESPENRDGIARTSWMLADPLWSSPVANPRVEFLARVAYAELRWSLYDRSIHGAETDRGDIYIRYGPPNKTLGFWPEKGHDMFEFWVYNADLIFAFDKHMHSGTADIVKSDLGIVDRVKEWQPARWDNIANVRVDSMPTQVARFRGARDSVDVFLATAAPVDTLRALTVGNVTPVAKLWLLARGSTEQYTDSVPLPGSGALQWTRRVHVGPFYYRVETIIPGTLVAARTTATMMMGADSSSGFSVVGYGLSDILLARTAASSGPARRWSDLDVTPILGDIPKGTEVGLVWENYELGQQNGSAHYDVVITMERERGKRGRVATQIVGLLGNAVGVTVKGDKAAMRFERTVPYAPVVTENVTMALGATPAGTYKLSVQVTDRLSKRVATRVMRVVIHE